MRHITLAVCIALGSSVAFAANEATTMPTHPSAEDYWTQHQKDGAMSRDDAMQYKGSDGMAIDVKRMDTNGDGRISQDEWKAYKFNKDASKSDGSPKGTGQ